MALQLNQELQNKYPYLEISVLKMSEVKENKYFRLDDEYYQKDYLLLDKNINKYGYIKLSDISKQITDFGAFSQTNMLNFIDNGVLFLRNQDIKESYIDLSNNVYIDKHIYDKLTLHLQENDILIPRVGTLGNAAIVKKEMLPCSANQNLAVVRLLDEVNPYVVILLLVSCVGKKQIDRLSTGNVQQWLNLEAIGNLKIPLFPLEFQQQIEQMVRESHACLEQSKDLYRQAEVLLYRELGLDPENPLASIETHSGSLNISVRPLSQSLNATGRLDSEYYQQKYDEIERVINHFPVIKLGDLVEYPISSGATPKSGRDAYTEDENGILFLRAVDLKNGEVDLNNAIKIKPEIHNGLLKRTKILPDDILFSIAGTIGRTAIYNHTVEANINQALSIIRFSEDKEINKLYFVTFFNSEFGQVYLEKYARQGLQTNLNLSEVANLEIPKINPQTQTQIAEKIKQSFTLRKQASELLQTAKQSVENAIEKG